MRDSLRTGIQTDVFLGGGKVNDVMSVPKGRHRPTDLFCRIRQTVGDRLAHLFQLLSSVFILRKNVLIYRLWSLGTKMMLILVLEAASASQAFPHRFSLFIRNSF